MEVTVKKICVIHRAGIGDILLATPVYRAIKETYPETQTVVITSRSGKELLTGNPYINALCTYEKGDYIFPVIKNIWRSNIALILDCHYRSSLFAWLARIPIRIGRGNKKKSFLTDQVIDSATTVYEPLKYLNITKQVNINTKNLDFVAPKCSEHEMYHVQRIFNKVQKISGKKKVALIAPYSLSALKNWPPDNYRKLISFLHNQNFAVAITSGREHYEAASAQFPTAINLAGATNLRETTYLISVADLLICGCTSALHLAATTNTPKVAIYGPTDPSRWAPKQNCTVITHNFSCSPCYNTGKSCSDNRCIKDITVAEVCDAVIKTLNLNFGRKSSKIDKEQEF